MPAEIELWWTGDAREMSGRMAGGQMTAVPSVRFENLIRDIQFPPLQIKLRARGKRLPPRSPH